MIGKYIEQLEDVGDLILYSAEVIKQVDKIPLGTLKKIMRSFPRMWLILANMPWKSQVM